MATRWVCGLCSKAIWSKTKPALLGCKFGIHVWQKDDFMSFYKQGETIANKLFYIPKDIDNS